ncbi:VirB4-like conjugal transfer ATPase, CD1110 family [Hominenteromicrobium sp.]
MKQFQDLLYEKSGQGVSFTGLLEAMVSEVAIVTAVHNIKSNKGSKTAGVDRMKMDKYLQMPKEELFQLIQSNISNYKPKPAKRKYIEKANGKKRPLGIPTVLDRIIQECMRLILEPICEARFYPHSYGFRPYRAQKHAIRDIVNVINASVKSKDQPVWAVEGDIKGCFDNINHRLLLKKLWRIGIHDKRVLKIISHKYMTISVNKKNIEDARNYFARVGADLIAHFGRLGSKCVELETDERLRIFHDFYRVGEESSFHFDIKETRKKGHSFKDYICPDSMEFEKDYFKMGDRYGRVLFLREYASYIKDSMVAELTDLNRNLMMSIDVVPVPTDEAVREAENRLLGVETNITNWQRRQNSNNNFSATVPYDMEQQKKEMKEFLDDLTTRDQRMMFAVITFVHTADSKEQLDNDTEALLTTARKHLCQFGVLKFQQVDGLNTVMPFGVRKIDTFRTLTTESLAVFIPFRVQDIFHENGIYYGQNVISKNMIIADRKQLLNGNSFILGVSGGGKSFAAKGEIENVILSSDSDVIIIDPEREYSQLVRALGGEVIHISATSQNHINAMDMTKEYGDGANPVILKSEFIMSLCEQLIGGSNLGAKQKSIIDRCTASVYRTYQQNNYQGEVPTLQDFREELLKQDEPEAQEIALAIELFTSGSLNTFAKHTNVDTNNRLICYDILDLGKQLMPIGMLVVLDSILNRITQNRAKGRNTFIFIDEIYLLFQHEYSANFLFTLWKRVRKYGAYATGITQNVDDLLQSHTARTMLANSEFIIMLNQASTDRLELAKLLNISDLQMSYITNVEAGHGLIKVGSSLVPFANKFPKNTKLYKLMTTKPGESA